MQDEQSDPFLGRQQQDVLRVFMSDGRILIGSYLTQAGMHLLHVKDGSLLGSVVGPIEPCDVTSLQIVRSRSEVLDERLDRSRGEPFPGADPVTRDGVEQRLLALARAAARAADGKRRSQLEYQFGDLADRVALAQTKRRWMLGCARWATHSNREPSFLDLSGGDLTMAAKFRRPRPQDFDLDPKARRVRERLPAAVRDDPRSVFNMIRALREAGFVARPSVLSETTHDHADLLVDFPGGKKAGRFVVFGQRRPDGTMEWDRPSWAGGDSRTGHARRRRAENGATFLTLILTLRQGRTCGVDARIAARQ